VPRVSIDYRSRWMSGLADATLAVLLPLVHLSQVSEALS
jgi:hypothetical protein